MSYLIWVSLPSATFGLIVRDGRIAEAPPIARWALGKPERLVADYYRRKGATFGWCPGDMQERR